MNDIQISKQIGAVTRMVAEASSSDDILERAARAVQDILPGELVAILDLNSGPDGSAQIRRIEQEEPTTAPGRLEGQSIQLDNAAILNHLADTCRTRVLDRSIQLDAELAPLIDALEGDQIRAALLVPIQHSGECQGFLAALSSSTETFTREHRRLARVYGDLLGIALSATQEVTRTRERAEKVEARNRALARELDEHSEDAVHVPWESPAIVELHALAQQVAETDAPVLLVGETGTGKEVMARQIHDWSPRKDAAFVALNCAALPKELIESELFGHAKGAFSGAHADRQGRFEVADGGTLLLDEIGEMPIELQPKLLRVLQEGTFTRIGENVERKVDARIIAATNVDLAQAIKDGEFREDLYFRLNVFPFQLPPLRDRLEDLPILCENILQRIHERTGRGPWKISEAAIRTLSGHEWPGNIRELVNTLERSSVLSRGEEIEIRLVDTGLEVDDDSQDPWPTLDDLTRRYIEKVLRRTQGKIYGDEGAAEILGIRPTTLQSRLKRMGIDREAFAS